MLWYSEVMHIKRKILILVIVAGAVLIAGVIVASLFVFKQEPGKLDGFAQCLKDKGAVFYGAFWCPHCQNQKKMFGSSERLLSYVECSTPSGQGQTQVCIDKKITGYPTWEFADGSRESGEVQLSKLAEKTGCELPKNR